MSRGTDYPARRYHRSGFQSKMEFGNRPIIQDRVYVTIVGGILAVLRLAKKQVQSAQNGAIALSAVGTKFGWMERASLLRPTTTQIAKQPAPPPLVCSNMLFALSLTSREDTARCYANHFPSIASVEMTKRKRRVPTKYLFVLLVVGTVFLVTVKSWKQRIAFDKITAAGGEVTVRCWAPRYLRDLVGAQNLGVFNSIVEIHINSPSIGDSELADIFNSLDLSNVDAVNLSGTSVGDEAMNCLRGCQNLTWLNISDTHVTDNGLGRLKELPALDSILAFQTRLSTKGVAEFKKHNTICSIDWLFRFGNYYNSYGRQSNSEIAIKRQLLKSVSEDHVKIHP